MTFRWISKQALFLLHGESLAIHGGLPGLRDEGLLDSTLGRAENLAAYGMPDYADCAAAYAFGIARNRPFADGNKRAAFLSLGLFLYLNGYRLTTTQVEATRAVLSLAAGVLTEAELSTWIRPPSAPRPTK